VHVALSALGVDRPGIVAAVSRVLFERGGNLEDSRMALLGGHFVMMLIAALPDDTDVDDLQSDVAAATSGMDLVVAVRPVAETHGRLEGAPYVLTVYGADRPGIVAAVTRALSDRGVNITDLATHTADGDVYIMVIEAVVPNDADPATIEAGVREAARDVDVSFHPIEARSL
jgi:glycine cleavage system transcriptional repressor